MMETVSQIPIWLDCDPGHDDAFAILLAAYHPSLRLLGVSTVYGNAPLEKTTNNALSILQAIGKPSIPVFPGAFEPFCRPRRAAQEIHGDSGLDGTNLLPKPSRHPLTHCNSIKEMRDSLMECPSGTAWLVATGALTNVALLFATFPEVVAHIKGLSIMGGVIGDDFSKASLGLAYTDAATGETNTGIGNYSPYAEFNIWCDPESAQSIFRNPSLSQKTVLIPLDLTHQALATEEVLRQLLGPKRGGLPTKMRQMFNDLLRFFAHTYAEEFGIKEGPPLHDPLAVAFLLSTHQDLDTRISFNDQGGERWQVEIVLNGEQIGRTKVKSAGEGVIVPRSLDLERFWRVVDDCLARADEATGYVT